MKNKFFNQPEFENAIKLSGKNPNETIIRLENYIKKYPNDYSAYPYYASVLIRLGYDEKAQNILEYVENVIKSKKTIKSKIDYLEQSILFSKFKLLSYQEKYKEIYRLYVNNFDKINDSDVIDIDSLIFYTRKKLGLLEGENRNKYYYLYRQMIEYREEDFLVKLQDYSYEYNQKNNNSKLIFFNKDFPIEKVLAEIKKYILNSPCIYNSFIQDTYVFKYNNCGKENNKNQNYFKVFCFHNTNNIIIMYPVSECEQLPSIDLNYLIVEEKENPKIKRISRIDKFNQKYKNRR